MNVQDIIEDIIETEGGFVDHEHDRGGATNFGITRTQLEKYRGRPVSRIDVENLERSEAFDIYYTEYYLDASVFRLPEELQAIALDMAINHGAGNAAEMIQDVLVSFGQGINVDGAIGRFTAAAASAVLSQNGDDLLNAIVERRNSFYKRIVENDPTQSVFLKGWLKRSENFRV